MTSVQKVLVVGGGIGGLVAALALRQRQIEVEIVEVNPKWDVYGVGILVQANALRALASVGLAEATLAAGYGMSGLRFHDSDGNILYEVPQPQLVGPQFPPACALTRPRFHTLLQKAVQDAGAKVRLGVTVDHIEQTGEAVEVTFTDGTNGRYDLVVGADGLRSSVREQIFGREHQPSFMGQMVWRCNVPRPPEVERLHVFYGKSGNKAGFVPISPNLMYIFLTETPQPGSQLRIPAAQLAAALRQRLTEFGGPVAILRDREITDPAKIVYRPFEEILLPAPWHRGRVVLIGDAVHAMSAHVAQGAAMAIEDAVVLAEELAARPALAEALQGYTERRYERCKSFVEIARELSRSEIENDHTIDTASLNAQAVRIAAQPI
jgi:2-polyprenyl-6-methoxyphenol hydroxylase-like FAD-dependent oxidoreductase